MSFNPATPEDGHRGQRAGNGNRVMPEPTRMRHRIGPIAPVEPSPASTYGETPDGDGSVPQTPQELELINRRLAGARAIKPVNLNAVLRIGAEDGAHSAIETPTGRPRLGGARRAAVHGQPIEPTSSLVADQGRNTAEATTEDCNRAQSREGSETAASSSNSQRTNDAWVPSAASSSLVNLSGHAQGSTSTRFVTRDPETESNDPFFSPLDRNARRDTANSSRRGHVTSTPTGHSSETDQSDQVSVAVATNERDEERHSGAVEPDQQITPENAQKVLPPSACVFVANLKSTCSDEELYQAVRTVFEAFGVVYIKIRRDDRGMPYAFCQYVRDEDAQRAIAQGRGKDIKGRACRTEPARVNRSVYLSRLSGAKVSENEARELLSQYGEIDHCWFCTETERQMYQLPEGIWVKFGYFQDSRDALSALRNGETYRLEQPSSPVEVLQRRTTGVRALALRPAMSLSQRVANMTLRTAMVPINYSRSIFIGNLSSFTTERRVTDICSEYGEVHAVEVVTRPNLQRKRTYMKGHRSVLTQAGANGYPIVYAFVQFAQEEEASRAIYQLHGRQIDHRIIRVEARVTPEERARRVPHTGAITAQTGRYSVQHQRAVSQVRRAPASVNVERAVQSNRTPTQIVPGMVVPPHLYGGAQEHVGTPHIPVTTPVTVMAATPVRQYPAFTQPQVDNQPASATAPAQSFQQAGYPPPAYYFNGNDAAQAAQAANWWQSYAAQCNQQYAPYWAYGYYPFPMQYGAQNNNPAPVAAATQSFNDTSAEERDQEVNASPRA
ncbi:MAG: hypothetical protein M1816_000742 [Peltula sp. TS41687]|nr:MAG: hypothetical protein M1816_000742 [Peltula sp. TS41687]